MGGFRRGSSETIFRARYRSSSAADPEILRRGGWSAEDNVSAPSSFIANALNELYAFYTEKGGLLKKKSEPMG